MKFLLDCVVNVGYWCSGFFCFFSLEVKFVIGVSWVCSRRVVYGFRGIFMVFYMYFCFYRKYMNFVYVVFVVVVVLFVLCF